MSKNNLTTNQELQKGESLQSTNGKYKAIFQEDGNFVVVGEEGVRWTSRTAGTDALRLVMKSDGDLLMSNSSGGQVWSTGTGKSGTYVTELLLTDAGTLMVYRGPSVVWTSAMGML